ncbi:MAG: glucose-1-phosphate thymidylyltransferase [Elusimicrobia bacterium GWC2_51_8]|nr:MAG: glucose-1-phosphate thymidylyltransferase [Elusimicrobia bacterium GWA2_51_34]OGR64352.1 MAG: glucose-1-phosphate thymidylyltransferase [Elusimicrobia bacterium GWC2_51_8]OGR88376.1 MAG: glucose-1-phosphate thymidylyltransferase [Elusimicrobia bacterium GWF2_52_66]HAF94592.1 glucose-1-phosphate thymidylyltransferase [Elusimicrobiota bacterium]HCE98074.1 glucose-1-phosphate thymidylyltransferase [Elusimicrobiota bacterium]
MKGIILAGGAGTRLAPLTAVVSKQLLPVYNKPMVYFPLATLMLAGVREILVISTARDLGGFKKLLGDGRRLGLKISYAVQSRPRGIAEALIIGEKFIGGENCWLILGDNIFFGNALPHELKTACLENDGATVFGYRVSDPERYGVLAFDKQGLPRSIHEKPARPLSNYAVTGLYLYDSRASAFAKKLKPSARGELEITGLNNIYLSMGALKARKLGRGYAWLDTGTYDSMLEASNFIQAIEKRQGLQIACVEEIAYHSGLISRRQFASLARELAKTPQGTYLKGVLDEL